MNEGDRTIAVFREASAAAARRARAARPCRDARPSRRGLDVRLRIAIAVGEAELVDGVYTGAAVDHVLGLRSIAAPGATHHVGGVRQAPRRPRSART